MVSPLQDLQNRINSNTLTVAQQSALSTSLAAIIAAGFDTPDERTAIVTDEANAREWYAALYAINAEGTSGGGAVLPTNQIAWFINATTGSNSNSGTSALSPLKTAAYLASLWRGTAGGGRPQLNPSSGMTVTVTLQTDLPSDDPISVLLDVDLAAGTDLIFVGGAKAATHTGTLATASTFARTSAGGQQKITDATVADYHPLVGAASLMQDSTSGGVAWLYGPFGGASATGLLSRLYTPQTPASLAPPTPADPSAADAYTLSDVIHCSIGTGFVTRSFPTDQGTSSSGSVIFYRLRLEGNVNSSFSSSSVNCPYFAQECMVDAIGVVGETGGAIVLSNCMMFNSVGPTARGGNVELIAGCSQGSGGGQVQSLGGGFLSELVADLDFTLISDSGNYNCEGGFMELANVGRYSNTPPGTVPLVSIGAVGGEVECGLLYGTDGGTCVENLSHAAGLISLAAPSVTNVQSSSTAFKIGGPGLTSAFGFDETTGAYVGPTTCTLAHLDAALAAGTGFGSHCVEPQSGDIVEAI